MAATRIIKSLSGRRFHGTPQPHWTAPLTLDSVLALESAGFELSTSAQKWKNVLFFQCPLRVGFFPSSIFTEDPLSWMSGYNVPFCLATMA